MGISTKLAIFENRKRAGDAGKREKAVSPSHRAPLAFFFFSLASLQHKRASAEERGLSRVLLDL